MAYLSIRHIASNRRYTYSLTNHFSDGPCLRQLNHTECPACADGDLEQGRRGRLKPNISPDGEFDEAEIGGTGGDFQAESVDGAFRRLLAPLARQLTPHPVDVGRCERTDPITS